MNWPTAALALAAVPALAASQAQPSAASVDGLPVGVLPPQQLPAKGCGAYFWSATPTRALIAMLSADPARIRFAPQGKVTDLERVAQTGAGDFGFLSHTDYAGGDWRVSVEMEIVRRGDLTQGAVTEGATLTIARDGADTVVVPVIGIIGCNS